MKLQTILMLNLLLALSIEAAGQGNIFTSRCKVSFSIENTKLVFKKEDDKDVNLVLKNLGNDTIYVPKWFFKGEKDDDNAEVIFEVEKWCNNQNKFTPYIPDYVSDYSYYDFERDSIALPPNHEKIYKQEIDFCFKIKKSGKYRFKLILRKLYKMPELKLDWKEFEVI